MATRAFLKVHAVGDVRAESASLVLSAFSRTYDALTALDLIRHNHKVNIQVFFREFAADVAVGEAVLLRRLMPNSLQLSSVVLQSPGFWEFLGQLNPLEALRKYLNDRHERMKDSAFRNDAEAERLSLENKRKQVQIVRDVIKLARDAKVPESQITLLVRELVLVPLLQLDTLQDKGLISVAELSPASGQLVETSAPTDV